MPTIRNCRVQHGPREAVDRPIHPGFLEAANTAQANPGAGAPRLRHSSLELLTEQLAGSPAVF
jgi:hypothetical protein